MQKQAPSLGRVLVMVGFALSCFGILLYLWLVFGGSTPLKPQGYRVHIRFPETTTLAQEADVRISGVPVGKVKKKEQRGLSARTDVELEIDRKYAPLPEDVRAILRQKTLLGETYVELTQGSRAARKVPDGGALPDGRVAPTVELDEIFRAFDERTRGAFKTWLDQAGRAVDGRGADLNAAIGNLAPFAEDTNQVLKILDEQSDATRRLVLNTGEVFEALSERRGQLRELITNSNRVFETTAARNRELADAFRVFPTFIDESRTTIRRVTRFANDTDPLITQLRPAARELSPTLIDLKGLAPHLKGLFRDLGPLITVSRRGLPALERFLKELTPLLAATDPVLRNVNPILDWLGLYKQDVASFFALDAAATQATDLPPGASSPIHYLRTTNPINPEVLAAYPNRLASSRSNPYRLPGGYLRLASGALDVFGTYLCTSNRVAPLNPATSPLLPTELRSLINEFAFGGDPSRVSAPPCNEQSPQGRLVGQSGKYAHVLEQPAR
jgi:phospholipid/cholesterol/gamma-HCH transport system substrate-binding protein